MHGTPLFSSDLKFSVETRKFIKSIQFKLESYKHEIVQKKQILKGQAQVMRNYFFAKVISNTNLGIEFNKPHLYIHLIYNNIILIVTPSNQKTF